MTKIYLIAGEMSGDFIGSHLMASLKNLYELKGEEISFAGVGGRLMEEAGLENSLFPIKKINMMGFFEIIPHIFQIIKLINITVNDIIQQKPDLLITIDSLGFTYRVAKKVRKSNPNLKILHIVAPSVWAYKPSRALKYAKIYNYLFALLPFEPPYFHKVGLDCRYIGHPIMEQNFYSAEDKGRLRRELILSEGIPNLNDISVATQIAALTSSKILCVTCGSRKGEIIRHMPVFTKAINIVASKFPDLVVIFVIADPAHRQLIESFLTQASFNYYFSTDRLKVFAASDAALAKSGTNTLEIAASGTPMVVAYKVNILSYLLIKFLIKIKYVSLINIIAGKEILPELIQFDCTESKIATGLISLLSDQKRANIQLEESEKIFMELGFKSANSPSDIAANIIRSIS
ncbi:MAG: lipid-A-disaccharide synthase [Candidatus Rickettsia vulgarisii]